MLLPIWGFRLELPKGKFARLRMDTLGARPARAAFNLAEGNETEEDDDEEDEVDAERAGRSLYALWSQVRGCAG